MNTESLNSKTKELRKEIVKSVFAAQSWHPWWSLSAIDLMTVLFYWWFCKFDSDNPDWEQRDYFIMSKWHWSPAYYALLADLWYFSKDELFNFRQLGSMLQWHPTPKVPWVEVSTGSLGQWLSVACGIAIWLNVSNSNNKVWALVWDWEIQEWQIWEAAMTANHYRLWNLVAIVDRNWLQIDWATSDVMSVWNIWDKFRSFWWEVLEVDWHDLDEIAKTYKQAIEVKDRPTCIVANTTKWKWVSFMEWQAWWHGKAPNDEQYEEAKQELEG